MGSGASSTGVIAAAMTAATDTDLQSVLSELSQEERSKLQNALGGASEPTKNSAFVFIKTHAITDPVKALVKKKLEDAGITILSEGSLTGGEVDEKKLVDQHYYAIASKATILKPTELNVPKEKFKEQFGMEWEEAMRSKFTQPGPSVHYFVVEWGSQSLPWAEFRGRVIGPTDPATAPAESLRGQIFKDWTALGLAAEPNIGDNSIHASASPFEALAERCNWLSASVEEDNFGSQLLSSGLSKDVILAWSVDPQVNIGDGKKGGLFDQVEDLDTGRCIERCVDLAKVQ